MKIRPTTLQYGIGISLMERRGGKGTPVYQKRKKKKTKITFGNEVDRYFTGLKKE